MVSEGTQSAFDTLYAAMWPALVGWVVRRFPALVSDAEDIAQEAVLRVWARYATQRTWTQAPHERRMACLYRTANNIAVDRLRHAEVRCHPALATVLTHGEECEWVALAGPDGDPATDPEQVALGHETVRELVAASPAASQPRHLMAGLYAGYSTKEIARTLRRSPYSVARDARSARRWARENREERQI